MLSDFRTALIAIALCLLLSPVNAGGIGIAPSEVNFQGVLRGGYAQKVLTITNPNDVPTTITLTPNGVTKPYLQFFSSLSYLGVNSHEKLLVTKITLPPRASSQLWIAARPGSDLQIGNYTGSITFYSKPQTTDMITDPFGTSIAVAVEIPVSMEITGSQRIEFSVGKLSVHDAELGMPIEFFVPGTNNGNVRATPQVTIKIFGKDKSKLLKMASFNGSEYLPTTSLTESFNVSSNNLSEGQYWANVTVSLGGKALRQEMLTFDLLEEGALKRNGELVQISSKVWAKTGEIIRVDAIFENTGEFPVNAKFNGEVYLNESLVSVLDSQELTVPIAGKVNLTTYFTPKEPGKYNIKGNVYYSKKVTFEKEAIVNVLPGSEQLAVDNSLYINLGLIAVIIVVLIILSKLR